MALILAETRRREVDSVDVKWTVFNFQQKMKNMKIGECLKLENISVGKQKWRLELYPAGETNSYKNSLSIYLEAVGLDDNTSIFVKSFYSIKSNDAEESVSFERSTIGDNYTKNGTSSWGFGNFITHSLINSDIEKFLSGGSLRLAVKIIVYGENETSVKTNNHQDIKSIEVEEKLKVSEDFKGSWMKEDFSDVKIKCGGQVFHCHKVVLASRSQFFRAMLESDFKESQTGIIDLEYMDVDTVKALLKYLYGGELDNMEENAMLLLEASNKFDLLDLKTICENYLIGSYMKDDNVIDVILMANLHNANHLKEAAMEMIVANIRSGVLQEGWEIKLKDSSGLLIEILKAIQSKK